MSSEKPSEYAMMVARNCFARDTQPPLSNEELQIRIAQQIDEITSIVKSMEEPTLEKSIQNAINRHSAENGSDTPDFILAKYLWECLKVWNEATQAREKWYGREKQPVKEPAL